MSYETTNPTRSELGDFDKPKLPGMLNVLTILTFIGCALQLIGAIWQFASAQKNYDEKDTVLSQMNSEEMPAFAKSMMGNPKDYEMMVTKNLENKVPLLIVGLLSAGLCLYGAMQMRKLMKQGYLIYVIGELLPFLSMVFFVGTFAMKGMGFYFVVFIALLFILLYTSQRKKLIY
ncbi:MAG: hypothetical protein WKF35_12175 [Ferruginibacter sp.]